MANDNLSMVDPSAMLKLFGGGGKLPYSTLASLAGAQSREDVQADSLAGVAGNMAGGTVLSEIAKGVTSGISASKKDTAQQRRDAMNAHMQQLMEWEVGQAQHEAELEELLQAESYAKVGQGHLVNALTVADEFGDTTELNRFVRANPAMQQVIAKQLPEGATFTGINMQQGEGGVKYLVPVGQMADGSTVNGSKPINLDSVLTAFAPDVMAVRAAARGEQLKATAELNKTVAETDKASAEADKARGEGGRTDWKEFETTSGTYATRIEDGRDQMAALINGGYSPPEAVKLEWVNNPYAYSFLGDQDRQYLQSIRNTINATLRRESGAVINPDEFTNARQQYIVTAEDDEKLANQKFQNISTVFEGFKQGSNGFYDTLRKKMTETPSAVAPEPTAPALEENPQAVQIRAQFKAGKISREDARAQLQALGVK
ncbi:hypothetical protein [Bradyrhizobium sp.]|uniref:hypothetical protein n=1 Tax=Bradyrhizobium sp. TaxID=376 RepID=UPI0027373AA2|nr:hypothetical protein [Bradyrhizobium sp.]MDP3078689.1 hypothetical protein [Bradyrhizobium sp.]